LFEFTVDDIVSLHTRVTVRVVVFKEF